MRGKVKWFNTDRGFGFIEAENGVDIFVHYSAIDMDGFKNLEEGAQVSFELTEGKKGTQASMVRTI